MDVEAIPTSARVVALTFDAGSSDAGVASVLGTLRGAGIKASFFLTGDFARRYPAQARRIADGGHRIGNHSDRHRDVTDLTDVEIRADLTRAEASIREATGVTSRPLFRFPYGARTAADIRVVNDAGYVAVRWTVDTLGWKGTSGGASASSVRRRVLDSARPGEIVLMHVGANPDDGTTLDADALPGVVESLRDAGYGFVTLDALLR
jgi:peptidoglycan/xylan/chitin deacetylase (PgdA/CDA1 family)